MGGIVLDLSKTFDKEAHNRLITKNLCFFILGVISFNGLMLFFPKDSSRWYLNVTRLPYLTFSPAYINEQCWAQPYFFYS